MEAIATVGDMADAEVFACRKEVLHTLGNE
jgi:hypothetical protein